MSRELTSAPESMGQTDMDGKLLLTQRDVARSRAWLALFICVDVLLVWLLWSLTVGGITAPWATFVPPVLVSLRAAYTGLVGVCAVPYLMRRRATHAEATKVWLGWAVRVGPWSSGIMLIYTAFLDWDPMHWDAAQDQFFWTKMILLSALIFGVLEGIAARVLKARMSSQISVEEKLQRLLNGEDVENGSSIIPTGPTNNATATEKLQFSGKLTMWQTMKVLRPYFWPTTPPYFMNRVRAVSTWVFVIGSKVCNVIAPILMANAVNELKPLLEPGMNIHQKLPHTIVAALVMYTVLYFASKALAECQRLVYIKVQQAAYVEIADTTFKHLHQLSLDWHLRKKMGNVIRAVDRGIQAAQMMTQYCFLYLIPTLGECAAVTVVFLFHFKNVQIAAICFFALSVYVYTTVEITIWRKKFRESATKHDNELHDRMTDSLVNFETIKYFTNENYESTQFHNAVSNFQRMSMATQASLSFLNIAQQLIINLTLGIGLVIAAKAAVEGTMDLGSFVATNVYIMNLFQPLSFLGTIYNMVVNSVVDMNTFGQLLAEETDVKDPATATELVLAHGEASVTFENVSFHYANQPLARSLKHVNFHVPNGTVLAIVGPTGAGKTSLVRLLFRFYDPIEGRVLLGGRDICHHKQQSVRTNLGIVPQDVVMFNSTLMHNVHYGNLNASEEEVTAALEGAQLMDFVRQQPDGWNTLVGERGLKLSGGEKQRLAIARCLLKDPPIVVLDEATSALDSATEKRVQKALNTLRADRTLLVIAHRLTTIRQATNIIALDAGEVTEQGTHDALLQRRGLYWRLWERQHSQDDEEEPQGGGVLTGSDLVTAP